MTEDDVTTALRELLESHRELILAEINGDQPEVEKKAEEVHSQCKFVATQINWLATESADLRVNDHRRDDH